MAKLGIMQTARYNSSGTLVFCRRNSNLGYLERCATYRCGRL